MGKQVDKNDFWFIEKNPITKVGVYPYLGKQISQDCEPDKIYWVLRPKEELFRKETLDSLRLIPLIDGHTMIGKDFTAPEDKGLDGTLGDNVSHDTDTIYNDLKIISNKMKDEIKNGKKELSLGYFCRYDKQPGTYKGQRYDYVQRDIIANHLALVDKGRMGADVRVYDSKNIPEGEAFAMDSIDIAIDKDEDIEWITVRGTHVPIKKGENKEQAVKKFLEEKNRAYKNKLFKEATKRVEEKEKNKLQKEAEEIQKRQSEREDTENLSFKDKQFRDATKKVEQKRLNEIKEKLGKQSGGEHKIGEKVGFKDYQGVEYKLTKKENGMLTFENIDDDSDKIEMSENSFNRQLKEKNAQKFGSAKSEPEKKEQNPFEKTLSKTGFKKDDNDYSYTKEYADGTTISVHSEKNDDSGKFYIADIVDKNGNMSQKEYHYQGIEDVFNKLNKEYEKSGQQKAGKKKKETTDSMEYKTIQGEGKMEKEKKVAVADEDKRKLIDEIGGILKDKGLDDEIIRTVIGKAEKIAYNKSETGDEGEEVEEEVIEEEKDKKPAKDKCGKDEDKKEEKKGMDEGEIFKMLARKEKLAKEVETVIGTFDHSEMTENQVAKYACDKLELGAVEGQELATLKGYLKAVASSPKVTYGYKTVAADGGIQKEDAEFEKFSKGE